jgi:hypothetical protein
VHAALVLIKTSQDGEPPQVKPTLNPMLGPDHVTCTRRVAHTAYNVGDLYLEVSGLVPWWLITRGLDL